MAAYRAVMRVLKLPYQTHNLIVHGLSTNVSALIEKRMIKFIYNVV